MRWKIFCFAGVIIWLALNPCEIMAAEFYEGKVVRIIVGQTPGGGFDTYSRAIARHFGKHIPGHPHVIVENMPGAQSVISANYIYNVAKPDGLTIGNFLGNLVMNQLLGREGIQFDIFKFEWIGVPIRETYACLTTKASGITSMKDLMSSKTPVKLGATSTGDLVCDVPKILQNEIGFNVRVVEGYKATAEIRLASDAGEVAGMCVTWEAVKPVWRRALETGDVAVILWVSEKPHRDYPNVPAVMEFAKTEEAKEVIRASIIGLATITRVYALPPGTPKERVNMLRTAFQETLKDPDFLEEANKAKLDINPVTGEEVEEIMARLKNLKPETIQKLKEIVLPKK